jgi:hypothetical protein
MVSFYEFAIAQELIARADLAASASGTQAVEAVQPPGTAARP